MVKDLVFGKPGIESIAAGTTLAGAVNGNGVDGQGFYAVKHVMSTGAITTSVVVKLQDSPDDSVFTDVVASEVVGADAGVNTVTFDQATQDNTVRQLGYLGLQRYTRLAVTAGVGDFAAVALQASNLATAAANS